MVGIAVMSQAVSGIARAQVLERVLMPGPVAEAHSAYEDQCASCHQPFSREQQRELCLDCHEEIAGDLGADLGFHGRSGIIPGVECAVCHTEHEGRDADIVGLDRDTFDHAVTDFPLIGSHAGAGCESCHATGARFREAERDCVACHRADDPHKGNLGELCADCHTESSWYEARFDHETTGFGLTGGHADVGCSGCHRNEIYADTPTACAACHRLDDVHAGRNGPGCQDCHNATSWEEASFDHFDATGFALVDGHAGLGCRACHSGSPAEESISSECVACHRADDVHLGINGTDCASCHAPTTWAAASFDHARDGGFALVNAHAELACSACHRGPVDTARPESTCQGCHRTDDVHQGQLGPDCQDCHRETGWAEAARFDHDLTAFPLLGLHAAVACEACHESRGFHDAPGQCVDCHGDDDAHEQRLGLECAACHTPNDWLIWQFDHDRQTAFALDGAHQGLDCLACHDRPVTDDVQLSTTCGSCHRGDDVHAAAFGTDCERCHTTTSFTELR